MDEKEGKPIFVGWREYEIRCHVLLLTLLLTLQADLHDLETCVVQNSTNLDSSKINSKL